MSPKVQKFRLAKDTFEETMAHMRMKRIALLAKISARIDSKKAEEVRKKLMGV